MIHLSHFGKPTFYATIVILCCSCLMGCDFLERDSPFQISKDVLFSKVEGIEQALAGAYNLTMLSIYNRDVLATSELRSGNIKFSSKVGTAGLSNRFGLNYAFNSNTDNTDDYNLYQQGYKTINQINDIIFACKNFPKGSETVNAKINRYLAEALGLRALCYFELLRQYAQPYSFSPGGNHIGIPYVTEDNDKLGYPKRTTVRIIYTFMIEDLIKAISLFEDTPAIGNQQKFWFGKDVAKALLARLYLYQEDWNNAIKYADELISSGQYSLLPSAQYLDSWNNNNPNTEIIFALDRSSLRATDIVSYFGVRTDISFTITFVASTDLYSLYNNDDIRKQLFVERSSEYVSGKFKPQTNNTDRFTTIFRLAEIYLIRAEASYKAGQITQARADLNTVAQRANPLLMGTTLSGDPLKEAIFLERRKELAYENHYYYDLTRTGRDIERTDCNADLNCNLSYPSPKLVLPIPRLALTRNLNLTQNTGY